MGFSSECLYCFHYPDSLGHLIFCCHGVAKGFTFILTVAELQHKILFPSDSQLFLHKAQHQM